jgi:hypothetical protein
MKKVKMCSSALVVARGRGPVRGNQRPELGVLDRPDSVQPNDFD